MNPVRRISAATVLAGALLFAGHDSSQAQVVPEPAMLTARVPITETFQAYVAFPDNSFVMGGMIRFPITRDADLGGRAGLWIIDDASDTPFVGADLRYGLLGRPLKPGGGELSLALNFGVGVSDPGRTTWKFPFGFIVGIDFGLGPGDAELFANPRLELGVRSNPSGSDAALLLDVGALFPIAQSLGANVSIRFGDGLFDEGDQIVVGLGATWQL